MYYGCRQSRMGDASPDAPRAYIGALPASAGRRGSRWTSPGTGLFAPRTPSVIAPPSLDVARPKATPSSQEGGSHGVGQPRHHWHWHRRPCRGGGHAGCEQDGGVRGTAANVHEHTQAQTCMQPGFQHMSHKESASPGKTGLPQKLHAHQPTAPSGRGRGASATPSGVCCWKALGLNDESTVRTLPYHRR